MGTAWSQQQVHLSSLHWSPHCWMLPSRKDFQGANQVRSRLGRGLPAEQASLRHRPCVISEQWSWIKTYCFQNPPEMDMEQQGSKDRALGYFHIWSKRQLKGCLSSKLDESTKLTGNFVAIAAACLGFPKIDWVKGHCISAPQNEENSCGREEVKVCFAFTSHCGQSDESSLHSCLPSINIRVLRLAPSAIRSTCAGVTCQNTGQHYIFLHTISAQRSTLLQQDKVCDLEEDLRNTQRRRRELFLEDFTMWIRSG